MKTPEYRRHHREDRAAAADPVPYLRESKQQTFHCNRKWSQQKKKEYRTAHHVITHRAKRRIGTNLTRQRRGRSAMESRATIIGNGLLRFSEKLTRPFMQ